MEDLTNYETLLRVGISIHVLCLFIWSTIVNLAPLFVYNIRQPKTAMAHADDDDEETQRLAPEDLVLLLLQEQDGRKSSQQEADMLLVQELGYTHRLSNEVLAYPLDSSLPQDAVLGDEASRCMIFLVDLFFSLFFKGRVHLLEPVAYFIAHTNV